jgi:PHD/YefM family antitoxin component YafN of YafNO toxin-antitoxin module
MVKAVDLKDLTDASRFRRLLEDIKKGEDQYILKDNGQPQAALLSLDDLELLEKAKADKEHAWQDLLENLKEVQALNPDVSEQQVHVDVDDAIRAVRQGHK